MEQISKPSAGALRAAIRMRHISMVDRKATIIDAELAALLDAMQDLIQNCWSRSDAAASKARAEAELAAWFGDKRRYKEMADHDC